MKTQFGRLWTRDYVMVMISNFTAAFSYAAFNTILSVYVNDIGGTNVIAGSMAACMTLVMMLFRPVFGLIVDRTGRRPVIMISGVLFALNTACYLLPLSVSALFAVRVVHGISQSMYLVSTQTMVADVVPEDRLVDGIGYFGVSSSLAGALGPMIGLAVYQNLGAEALFVLMTVFSAIGAAAALLIRTDFKPEKLPSRGFVSSLKGLIEPTALLPGIIIFSSWFGYAAVSNFLATCAQARSIGSISLFFTIASCCMILTRLFSGKLTGLIGIGKPIAGGLVLVSASLVIVAFAGSLSLVLLAGVLYGLGFGMLQPLLNVLVLRFCGPSRRGAASATFGLLSDMGAGLGAAVWGVTTVSAMGYTGTYLLAAAVPLCGLALYAVPLRRKMRKAEIR